MWWQCCYLEWGADGNATLSVVGAWDNIPSPLRGVACVTQGVGYPVQNIGGSKILVRRAQQSFEPRGEAEPKICSKLPENCMILKKKSWEQEGSGPMAPWIHLCKKKWCLFDALSQSNTSTLNTCLLTTDIFSEGHGCWRRGGGLYIKGGDIVPTDPFGLSHLVWLCLVWLSSPVNGNILRWRHPSIWKKKQKCFVWTD